MLVIFMQTNENTCSKLLCRIEHDFVHVFVALFMAIMHRKVPRTLLTIIQRMGARLSRINGGEVINGNSGQVLNCTSQVSVLIYEQRYFTRWIG